MNLSWRKQIRWAHLLLLCTLFDKPGYALDAPKDLDMESAIDGAAEASFPLLASGVNWEEDLEINELEPLDNSPGEEQPVSQIDSPSIFPEEFPTELKYMVLQLLPEQDKKSLALVNHGCAREVVRFLSFILGSKNQTQKILKENPRQWSVFQFFKIEPPLARSRSLEVVETLPGDPELVCKIMKSEEKIFPDPLQRHTTKFVQSQVAKLRKLSLRSKIPLDYIVKIVSTLPEQEIKTFLQSEKESQNIRNALSKKIIENTSFSYERLMAEKTFKYIDCLLALSKTPENKFKYLPVGITFAMKVVDREKDITFLADVYKSRLIPYSEEFLPLLEDEPSSVEYKNLARNYYNKALNFFNELGDMEYMNLCAAKIRDLEL